jgi:hypothetical protein
MSDYSSYGERYFCIGHKDGRIQLHADRATVTDSGDLVLTGRWKEDRLEQDEAKREEFTSLALPKGTWDYCYAASVLDNSPVAIERGLGWEAEGHTYTLTKPKPRPGTSQAS